MQPHLTIGLLQPTSVLTAPPNWMDVFETRFTPVVIVIAPAIKVDVQLPLSYASDGCHTDETGVLYVPCLKLTVDTETTNHLQVIILQGKSHNTT